MIRKQFVYTDDNLNKEQVFPETKVSAIPDFAIALDSYTKQYILPEINAKVETFEAHEALDEQDALTWTLQNPGKLAFWV